MTWNGTRWSARGTAPLAVLGDVSMDCTSASFCMVSSNGVTSTWTGAGWRPPVTVQGFIAAVGCQSAIRCFGTTSGGLFVWDGTQWAQTSMAVGDDLTGQSFVRCVGTSRCVVAAGAHIWWTS
ncbi:hypothetical protein G7075_03680 [Phycicoccus sp. HDW14]|uniref:hypothetical protein n=1 Tax=Phycicoccus sp. HDW14 TaxID=2714941 RepID=UPI00140B06BF|nr:hypothetical protein [Phycicoccus sp. HDW14]QIM20453.1 hypothetical protein G7075_03680 [Phycicoccus sp. HDW14]